jgi:hypothetical protein
MDQEAGYPFPEEQALCQSSLVSHTLGLRFRADGHEAGDLEDMTAP